MRWVGGVALDLQIQEPHGVPGAAGSPPPRVRGPTFKRGNVRVEQRSGMNEQNFHGSLRGRQRSVEGMTELSRSAPCWSRPSQSVFGQTRPSRPSPYVRLCPLRLQSRRSVGGRTKYRRVSRLSASTICGCSQSACANAEACPLNA